VAAFTKPSTEELTSLLGDKYAEFQAVEGGSVNSNFSFERDGRRWFLRIYEEQDAAGAEAERAMVAALASAGVPTPVATAHGTLAGKPAAVFPWVDGMMSCQRAVTPARAAAVGAALGRVALAGKGVELSAGRFHEGALLERTARIPVETYPIVRIRTILDDLAKNRDRALPTGLVHGDLFRDNVLWSGDASTSQRPAFGGSADVAALLDFESAFRGPLAYDLAVLVLSWAYADAFVPDLARAMVRGYESVRPLEPAEKRALYTETRFGAVRFTITRITDYAMRGGEGRVMKDWRRFLARLDALEAMGQSGFDAMCGI
jgi:homoserine kinase type II